MFKQPGGRFKIGLSEFFVCLDPSTSIAFSLTLPEIL